MFRNSLFRGIRQFSSKLPQKPKSGLPKKSLGDEVRPKAFAPSSSNIELSNDDNDAQIKGYVPIEKHQRVSFEYPDEPSKDESEPSPKLRRIAPIGLALLGGLWGLYTFSYFADSTPTEYLSQDKFIPFIITNRLNIDDDHYIIELTPKYNKWKKNRPKIWDGNKIWSVEVKQPEIMVVRKYTPLPLELFNSEVENKQIVRIQTDDNEGKLAFYIKKYKQGEVARWIHRRSIGSELELRGPFVEYEFEKTLNNNFERPQLQNLASKVSLDPKFPIKPDTLAFFAAGTGIAPVLQIMTSKNPYRGFIEIFYSRRSESEVPIPNFLYFLEKLNRCKIYNLSQEKGVRLSQKQIPQPTVSNWKKHLDSFGKQKLIGGEVSNDEISKSHTKESSILPKWRNALEEAQGEKNVQFDGPSLALVCGPDGYVEYVSGAKPFEGQGEVGGLLKEKGWDKTNVFKL